MDLLLKIVVGVVATAGAAVLGYEIYKVLTKEKIKEDVQTQMAMDTEHPNILAEAVKLKVLEKVESGQTVTLAALDEWDEPINNYTVTGDEISEEIEVGTEIMLNE